MTGRALTPPEQAAIAAVARHFSAATEPGNGDWPDAYVTVAGQRVAIQVTATRPENTAPDKPRLRFDKVVQRLVGHLQAALPASVADGEAVLVTCTAPIRLPGKTATALESMIRGRSAPRDVTDTIHGNQVRIRLVTGISPRMPKVIGFVHNPESDAGLVLDLTESLLRHIGAAADRRPPVAFTGTRWLVIANESGFAHIETWRHIHAQLSASAGFQKILMVLSGGRVETLGE